MGHHGGRRTLHFASLAEVVEDAERLHRDGYDKAGAWDLAQVAGHLAEWLRFPVEGFPKAPPPIRLMLWAMRRTIGRRALRKVLDSRAMPGGRPTLRETVPPPGGDEAESIGRLREAVDRFTSHPGPFHPSPIFGALDRDQATRLQRIHCAHHLSFLVPRPREGAEANCR